MAGSAIPGWRDAIAELWRRPFARFLAIGVVNTAFGYAVFGVLLLTIQEPTLSVVLATIIGVPFNFRSIGAVVFDSRDPWLLPRFVFAYVLLTGVNVALLKALMFLGLPPMLGQASLILPLALLSYVLNRNLVFVKSRTVEGAP